MPITNTSAMDPMFHLIDAMSGRGSIERSEARGQQDLVSSTQLPTECSAEDKAKLEAAGVVFGEPNKDDPMFCDATLPAGWRKVATDHSMWSDLVDGNGVKRGAIFYKAAFYDRNATLYAE